MRNHLVAGVLGAVGGVGIAGAQASIDWFSIDSGGGRLESADGSITLVGSIGQADAGPTLTSSDGSITLTGGFIPGILPSSSGACEGDANGDLQITIADVLFIIARFGDPAPSSADVNGDDQITIADVLFAIARFGNPCD